MKNRFSIILTVLIIFYTAAAPFIEFESSTYAGGDSEKNAPTPPQAPIESNPLCEKLSVLKTGASRDQLGVVALPLPVLAS